MKRSSLPLGAVVLTVFAGIAVLVGPGPVRLLAGILLLLLPGILATFALFPSATIERAARTMLALGLALVLAALAALVLDVTVGLRRATWVVALVVVTAVAAGVAAARAPEWGVGARLTIRPVRVRDLVVVAGGVAILGVAIAVMRAPLHATDIQGYTALSLLPAPRGRAVAVGVTSGELKKMTFRLVVRSRGSVVYDRTLPPLAPGAKIERSVPLPHARRGDRVTADLLRPGVTGGPYRSTSLTVRPT